MIFFPKNLKTLNDRKILKKMKNLKTQSGKTTICYYCLVSSEKQAACCVRRRNCFKVVSIHIHIFSSSMEEVTKLFLIEIKKMEKFCWLNPLFSQWKLYVRIKHAFTGPISYKQRPPPLGQFHTNSSSALWLLRPSYLNFLSPNLQKLF